MPMRRQLWLLAGGVLWLLAMLALITHNAADPAFSTSGTGAAVRNKAGQVASAHACQNRDPPLGVLTADLGRLILVDQLRELRQRHPPAVGRSDEQAPDVL